MDFSFGSKTCTMLLGDTSEHPQMKDANTKAVNVLTSHPGNENNAMKLLFGIGANYITFTDDLAKVGFINSPEFKSIEAQAVDPYYSKWGRPFAVMATRGIEPRCQEDGYKDECTKHFGRSIDKSRETFRTTATNVHKIQQMVGDKISFATSTDANNNLWGQMPGRNSQEMALQGKYSSIKFGVHTKTFMQHGYQLNDIKCIDDKCVFFAVYIGSAKYEITATLSEVFIILGKLDEYARGVHDVLCNTSCIVHNEDSARTRFLNFAKYFAKEHNRYRPAAIFKSSVTSDRFLHDASCVPEDMPPSIAEMYQDIITGGGSGDAVHQAGSSNVGGGASSQTEDPSSLRKRDRETAIAASALYSMASLPTQKKAKESDSDDEVILIEPSPEKNQQDSSAATSAQSNKKKEKLQYLDVNTIEPSPEKAPAKTIGLWSVCKLTYVGNEGQLGGVSITEPGHCHVRVEGQTNEGSICVQRFDMEKQEPYGRLFYVGRDKLTLVYQPATKVNVERLEPNPRKNYKVTSRPNTLVHTNWSGMQQPPQNSTMAAGVHTTFSYRHGNGSYNTANGMNQSSQLHQMQQNSNQQQMLLQQQMNQAQQNSNNNGTNGMLLMLQQQISQNQQQHQLNQLQQQISNQSNGSSDDMLKYFLLQQQQQDSGSSSDNITNLLLLQQLQQKKNNSSSDGILDLLILQKLQQKKSSSSGSDDMLKLLLLQQQQQKKNDSSPVEAEVDTSYLTLLQQQQQKESNNSNDSLKLLLLQQQQKKTTSSGSGSDDTLNLLLFQQQQQKKTSPPENNGNVTELILPQQPQPQQPQQQSNTASVSNSNSGGGFMSKILQQFMRNGN